MKNRLIDLHPAEASRAHGPRPLRYQIYRQARAGNYMTEFQTDSAEEAVEVFAIISPAFDGGAVRIWDQHEQSVCASVLWFAETTEFGFPVQTRINLFHDGLLAGIACRVQERKAWRDSVRQETLAALAG